MSLIDLITGNAGTQVAEQAENKFGISKGQIIALLAVAAPLIISYLKVYCLVILSTITVYLLRHIFGSYEHSHISK